MQSRVALVLVSHSRPLAEGLLRMLQQVAGDLPMAIAAGVGEGGQDLGTDATAILAALEHLDNPAGILLLVDLGSALLSAETALQLAESSLLGRVQICPAPFVEGAIAAAVAAAGGLELTAVCSAARTALDSKMQALRGDDTTAAGAATADHKTIRSTPEADEDWESLELQLQDPAGLHLRPAAALLRLAAEGESPTFLARNDLAERIPLDSLSGLLSLSLRQGDRLHLYTRGPHAQQRLAAMATLLTRETPSPLAPATSSPRTAVPGTAVAPVYALRQSPVTLPVSPAVDPEAELAALREAIRAVEKESADDEILAAQRLFLQDSALLGAAERGIRERGLSAAQAWLEAATEIEQRLAAIPDPTLRARRADLLDLRNRVLQGLVVSLPWQVPDLPSFILLADELPPSVARRLDPARVLGVLDRRGGQNSHAAILLRAAGIPYLVGIGAQPIADGTLLAMDAGQGRFWLHPSPEEVQQLQGRQATLAATPASFGLLSCQDGSTLEFWANISSRAEAEAAARLDVRGVGLLRSEFLFLDARAAPTEAAQEASFRNLFAPLQGRPIVVRLLDAGADKALPFLQLPKETNPALGLRGIRALERRPEFLHQHLRAILRAGAGHDLRLLLPMVTAPAEVTRFRAVLREIHQQLTAENLPHPWPVAVGIMVEVPAVALDIDAFIAVTDFFSLGTNDLGQYTAALDREQTDLPELEASSRAALLELCARTVQQGKRPVSVCGEAAADPAMAREFLRIGLRRLSLAPARLPALYVNLQAECGTGREAQARAKT
ncbi:MAG: HPr family phosphocarrier protein [Acidithiobacillus sp.]|nr:HPr family phosphocarrier protein [Acidithiobacillus sp.]